MHACKVMVGMSMLHGWSRVQGEGCSSRRGSDAA